MKSITSSLLALLVTSNVNAAEAPREVSMRGMDDEPRIYMAQVQGQAERGRSAAAAAEKRTRESQRAPTEDEALALAALEGLMAQPSERALPIIKKVLAGSHSTLI